MSDVNGVMMQYFHWYLPPQGNLWNQLSLDAEKLAAAGFTALWLPPAYKPEFDEAQPHHQIKSLTMLEQ